MKPLKDLYIEIRDWKQGYLRYLKYSWFLTVWTYKMKALRQWNLLLLHIGTIRRLFLVAAGITAGLVANYYGALEVGQGALGDYLTAVAAMTGGTIAIIFSISIFLLQGVADLYSSKHFEAYTNDWKDQLTYIVVIGITLALFATGLYVGSVPEMNAAVSSYIVLASLSLIGVVFALIDFQYGQVRKKINPVNAIAFLERRGARSLKQLHKTAQSVAKLITLRDASVSPDQALANAYDNVMKKPIAEFDAQLESLVDLSLKLFDKEEMETTKRALNASFSLLKQFLEARRTSSIARPSPIAFLAVVSDSQGFLTKNFIRLNKAGSKFIKEGNDELAGYVVDIYRGLAIAAKEVQYRQPHHGNPILDLLVGYLEFYIQEGKETKNLEVVYQGSRALGEIAVFAIQKGLSSTLYGIQGHLLKDALYGLQVKQSVIYDQSSVIYLNIIKALFLNTSSERHLAFKEALDNIATITTYITTYRKAGVLPTDIGSNMSWSKAYDEFYQVLAAMAQGYEALTDDREKSRYRSDMVELFRELNMSLRQLSEKKVGCDHVLADSIGRLMSSVNEMIIGMMQDDEFAREKEELRSRLGWNIHLPGWFAHHVEKFDAGSNPFNTLTDSIAKTGILAAERIDDEATVKTCIGALDALAKQALEKGESPYGYDEPRILEKACYLGVIALKKGWNDVVVDLRAKIAIFEASYFAKYLSPSKLPTTGLPAGFDPRNHSIMGLPHHDQLYREIYQWRARFDYERRNGTLRIRDDAQAMMYQVVERADIDRFVLEVWGITLGDDDIDVRF